MAKEYSPLLYKKICQIEKTHFWFLARNKLIQKIIQKYLSNNSHKSFFEIGFGTGTVLETIEKNGYKVSGIDINREALHCAESRIKGKLSAETIFDYKTQKKFDGVGAFDVLEHVENDVELLHRAFNLLDDGGYLFLTVPAKENLWSKIDVLSGHVRRYEIDDIKSKLGKAGFTIVYWNYWQFLILPALYFWRKLTSEENDLDKYLLTPPWLINKILYFLLLLEACFIFVIKYPKGGSIIICAKKREQSYAPLKLSYESNARSRI
jgi:SAM-dependent methyltransferase